MRTYGFGFLLAVAACSSSASNAPSPADADAGVTCTDETASSENISISNDYGTLDGTLSFPERCGQVPVVVILSGTGQTDRNANGPNGTYQTDAYAMLSDALVTTSKVAVLRYDDHGVGKSVTAMPKDGSKFTLDLEVTDAGRWVEKLHADPRISKVFLAGHSLGSLMATLVAEHAQVDGVISLEGPGRPMTELFHDQVVTQMTADELAKFDAALAELTRGTLPGKLDGILGQAIPVSYQPYMASFLKYDPGAEFAKLAVPALIVHGDTDKDVPIIDANVLHEKMPAAPIARIALMAHMLKHATNSARSQDAARNDKSVPLAAGLPPALQTFLDANR